MSADLIVYAVIAAGLVFWLRSVLGTRHGEERERPNPFTAPEPLPGPEGDEAQGIALNMTDKIKTLAETPKGAASIANKSAEAGLQEIAEIDKDFDIDIFIAGAQDAFAMIVEAFASGDRTTLKDLLAPSVYAAFEGAIAGREQRQETMTAEIQSIRKAEVIEALLDRKMALITLRFEALELTCTKDAEGRILHGNPDKPAIMRDVWVFAREVKSRDPRWFVTETRGDFEDDNETLPNA